MTFGFLKMLYITSVWDHKSLYLENGADRKTSKDVIKKLNT